MAKERKGEGYSKLIDPSDEAIQLQLAETYYWKWEKEARASCSTNSSSGSEQKQRGRRTKGFKASSSDEGLKTYGKYMKMARQAREKEPNIVQSWDAFQRGEISLLIKEEETRAGEEDEEEEEAQEISCEDFDSAMVDWSPCEKDFDASECVQVFPA